MSKVLAINDPVMNLTADPENKKGFPIEVFPNEIQHIITAYNKTLNFPTEFTAAAILTSVPPLVGNNLKLRVKTGFDVPIHIFYITVQERGMKKSSPMSAILKPIYSIDKAKRDIYEAELDKYKRELLQAQKNSTEYEEPEPTRKQTVINRTTPEALFKIHKQNPKGILMFINEAKEWFGTFNQHSNNAEEQTYCQMYDGEFTSRTTLKNGQQDIENPCVTILGSIQPNELTGFISKNTDNGLTDRIIFDYPDYLKITKESRDEMSQDIIDNWEKIVNTIHGDYKEYVEELVQYVRYSPEAIDRWYNWNESNTNKIHSKNDLVYQGIVKKAETNCHRLALNLQVLNNTCKGVKGCSSVDLNTLESAIVLCDYYIEQAMKIRNRMELNKTDKMSVWFSFLPEGNFTTKQAYEVGVKAGAKERTVDNYLMKHPRIERADPDKRGLFKKILS